jgi:ribosomal protein S18 acetylase RimI-like enzyme
MSFDAAVSLRIAANQRLMRDTHRGEYRDLGGALAITSDAPVALWNCIEGFTTDERRLDGLLDIGFALLRAFDQPPAARLTPLDRPRGIDARLRQRGLLEDARETSMIFRGDAAAVRINGAIEVRRAAPDDASFFATVEAQVNAPKEKWARGFLLGAALANILEETHAFYIARAGSEPVGTALVVREDGVAGIYSVATLKAHRRAGVASTLMARAVNDAQASGAEIICLECATGGDAMLLFSSLGFEPAHESVLWTGRE